MSIERAIERVEEKWGDRFCEYRSDTMNMIYFSILNILKEEAEPPCERCKNFILCDDGLKACLYQKCKWKWGIDDSIKDLFNPKEEE